jgi:RNA polymerase sigma-70 factor (ECF subfamily)
MNEERDEVQELIARARAGDVDAFEALYRRHQAGIYTFIRSQVREPELAADLAQETFIRAWQSLSRLRKAGAFRGWLHRIAANLVRDEVKSGRARLEVTASALASEDGEWLPESVAAPDEGPVATLAAQELKTQIWSALDALPAEQRAAVVMHHLEGMSMQEIAEAMSVRPGTVMSRLARAREALRKRLAGYVEASDD